VSDRGDHGDDHPQPADPWEIDPALLDAADDPAERRGGRRRRRRGTGWGRRRDRHPGPDDLWDSGEETSPPDAPAWAGHDESEGGRPRAPFDADEVHVVDEPAWAADTTRAADHIDTDGLAGEVEEPTYDEPPETDEALDDWSTAMAERSPYGVSTPEAFAALSADEEQEGFEDWESFVAESASDRLPYPPDLEDDAPPATPMSRRQRRLARREAKRAVSDASGDAADEPDDAIPGWVEGGPDETAWLEAGDDGGEAWADSAAAEDEADAPGAVGPVGAGDPIGAEETSPVGAAADEAPPDATPDVDDEPAPTGEDVWLVSEQPLVVDEVPPIGPREGAADASRSEPLGPDWSPDEEADAGYDEADVDEWVTGSVGYGDAPPPGASEPGSAPGPSPGEEEAAITEDLYAQSVTIEHVGLAEEIFRAGEGEDLEWQAVSAAMPGIGTGVVGWDDVADLGTDQEEYVERDPSDLGTRIGTGLILVGLLIGAMWVGPEAFAVFVGLLVLVALGEFYTALRMRRFRPIALFGYVGGIGALVGTWYHGPMAIAVAIGATAVVAFFAYAFAPLGRDALTNGGLTVLGVAWVTGAAAFALPLVQAEEFRVLVLTVVAVTVAMDLGAFAVGRMWGRRPLAPMLSPNKTLEGLFGGIAVTIGAALGAAALFEAVTVSETLWLAAVVIVLAPVGDLAESMMKRSLQLKDMGTILPGHGGVLDRIDAFLFILPGAWALFKALGLIA
jgi:phosphatidate cytidylyltransferase